VLSVAALAQLRRRPYCLVGWLWFLGMLVPVIGLVQVGSQGMADRYGYLPLTGLALALGMAGAGLAAARPRLRGALGALAAACVLGLGVASFRQLVHWRDGLALFERALAVAEESAVVRNGLALLERGRATEALPHLRRALELDPRYLDARVNLGVALLETGQTRAAVAHLQRGLSLPGLRGARVHAQLGLARLELEQPEPALAHLATAERLGLDLPELDAARAQALQAQGRIGQAIARYERALAARPDWPEVANNLAWLLATAPDPQLRRPDEAVRLAESAVRAIGPNPGALDTLSAAYAAAGRRAEALESGRRAAALARAAGNETLAGSIEARLSALEAP
jgi:tetratricopeptide (TPR) repeat protein